MKRYINRNTIWATISGAVLITLLFWESPSRISGEFLYLVGNFLKSKFPIVLTVLGIWLLPYGYRIAKRLAKEIKLSTSVAYSGLAKKETSFKIKLLITLLVSAFLILALITQNWKIDTTILALLIIGILPWLASIITSLKLPGGIEVAFKDIQAAAAAAESLQSPRNNNFNINVSDPNLALVALRIEIELKMKEIAEHLKIRTDLPLRKLLREIFYKEAISPDVMEGLEQLIMAGNQAAHGAAVDEAVAHWASSSGIKYISTLSQVLTKLKKKK